MLPSPMKALRKFKENTPDELHIAVVTGRIKRMKHLLKNGVHIESVNAQGQTPLYCASYGGDHEVVSLLLRLGANPNRRCGSKGTSPVHAAAYRGSRRVLRLLIEFGGDLTLRDNEFRTPKDYADKQPSHLRRQKILDFIEILQTMTLYRTPHPSIGTSSALSSGTPFGTLRSEAGTLKHALNKQKSFFGSQISLNKKSPSTANIWASCVVGDSVSPKETIPTPATKELTLPDNLRKNVSCHLLNELCVTTSLPLLSPNQLDRPDSPTKAYTCGGPTLFSSYSWLGTPVTVRRPTPHLSWNKKINMEGIDSVSPDPNAVKSLLQELSLLRRLRHPGFLEVMAACHVTNPSPDHVTLVFQHVPHGSLYHHLHVQHHDLLACSAVDILIGVVEALLFMHAHGWLHCGLSSHAIHLVSLTSAKLGSFEYALESKAKGCGMRAEYLSIASWLRPWQAPETIVESMVSVRSEIYSLSVILWEIWSGMPPWCGVEEAEVSKKVASGETLPILQDSTPSLVSYLTQYGLKWNDHERELDLQEVHTMLKSLKIQCREEERVPAVTAWAPPSIPNTPVIGRNRASQCSDSDMRLADAKFLSGGGSRLKCSMDKTDGPKSTSADSGFSSPHTRTPSPESSSILRTQPLTSTPYKYTPDLLPNKISPRSFMVRTKADSYDYVQSAAKRAFLQNGTTQSDVVKRGLSLTNICNSQTQPATIFTRTTSHISLCSSSNELMTRRPQRTVSQIILTMKKLSSSTSSNEDTKQYTPRSGPRPGTGWEEITAIKPASHQLTRHSSSCSLASNPSSPARPTNYSFPARRSRLAGSHGSIPVAKEPKKIQPISSRPSSLYGDSSEVAGAAKLPQKRHRLRKQKKRDEVEIEEEFIDDEFNATLFDQPHMQLSMSSSDNLLDRLSSSVLGDESGSSSCLSSHTGSEDSPQRNIASKNDNTEESDDDIFSTKPTDHNRLSLKKHLEKGVGSYLPKYSLGCSDSDDV